MRQESQVPVMVVGKGRGRREVTASRLVGGIEFGAWTAPAMDVLWIGAIAVVLISCLAVVMTERA